MITRVIIVLRIITTRSATAAMPTNAQADYSLSRPWCNAQATKDASLRHCELQQRDNLVGTLSPATKPRRGAASRPAFHGLQAGEAQLICPSRLVSLLAARGSSAPTWQATF